MNVLITSGSTPLAQALAGSLAPEHRVRVTDLIDTEIPDFLLCDLGHEGQTEQLVAGTDAIVHLAALPESLHTSEREIDFHTRCTYNLLIAARAQKVPHVIYASSLSLFQACDPSWSVTETWAPRPCTEAAALAHHLGECTCREFAREGSLRVTCLRLGHLHADQADPMALHIEDAVSAITKALTADGPRWQVLHLQSEVPDARFPIDRAKEALGL